MDVQVQCAAKPLDERYCTALCCLPGQSGLFDEVHGNSTIDHTQHLAHQFGAAGEQKSQLVREAEHPLAHWLVGQDFVHQQSSAFGHAPGATTGAKATPFTAKRNQPLFVTGTALYSQKSMFQPTAFQIFSKFFLYMVG